MFAKLLLTAAALALGATAGPARAETVGVIPQVHEPTAEERGPSPTSMSDRLMVCASAKDAPYSTATKDGFENRIADALAQAMGREVEFVFSERASIYNVRDLLEPKQCDVVFGIDPGDPRVETSEPYFRTAYAFVSRADAGFDGHRWQDAGRDGLKRFATRIHSPAQTMLKYAGKYEDNLAYLYGLVNFKSNRNAFTEVAADRLASEVRNGEADLAIAFAPDVARYVAASDGELRLTLIENSLERQDGVTIPLQYGQTVGVRKGDDALLKEINEALAKAQDQIRTILEEEGIPLLPLSS